MMSFTPAISLAAKPVQEPMKFPLTTEQYSRIQFRNVCTTAEYSFETCVCHLATPILFFPRFSPAAPPQLHVLAVLGITRLSTSDALPYR